MKHFVKQFNKNSIFTSNPNSHPTHITPSHLHTILLILLSIILSISLNIYARYNSLTNDYNYSLLHSIPQNEEESPLTPTIYGMDEDLYCNILGESIRADKNFKYLKIYGSVNGYLNSRNGEVRYTVQDLLIYSDSYNIKDINKFNRESVEIKPELKESDEYRNGERVIRGKVDREEEYRELYNSIKMVWVKYGYDINIVLEIAPYNDCQVVLYEIRGGANGAIEIVEIEKLR